MRGTWPSAVLFALLIGVACDSSKNKPVPATSAPAKLAEAHAGPSADARAATDDGAQAAATRDPIASRFKVAYAPGELQPEPLRQRIRLGLKDRSRAPIAVHHLIDIPKPDGGREVFALYEYSVYEDCMARWPDPTSGRKHCLSAPVTVVDGMADQTIEERNRDGKRFLHKEVRLNQNCVAMGAVHAVFSPPGPGETAETAGLLAIGSFVLADARCQVRNYNHVLVADVDGDGKLEIYIDLTSVREGVGKVRGPDGGEPVTAQLEDTRRTLYVLSADDVPKVELSLGLSVSLPPDTDPDGLAELHDVDHDGHLDVIETSFCYQPDYMPCDPPTERIVYIYDPEKDAYRKGVASRDLAKRLHDRAMKDLAARQFDAATQIWHDAAVVDPDWSWPPYNLACVAALQGHTEDAITQLQLLVGRAPDLDLVHRLDTDHDLASLRDLPAFQKTVDDVARAALQRRHFARPEGDGDIPLCASISFFDDGRYWYSCDRCCRFSGTYSYAQGRIQLQIDTLARLDGTHYGPPQPVEIHGTYQLTAKDRQVCFERIEATGLTDDLPSPPLPDGCWK